MLGLTTMSIISLARGIDRLIAVLAELHVEVDGAIGICSRPGPLGEDGKWERMQCPYFHFEPCRVTCVYFRVEEDVTEGRLGMCTICGGEDGSLNTWRVLGRLTGEADG